MAIASCFGLLKIKNIVAAQFRAKGCLAHIDL